MPITVAPESPLSEEGRALVAESQKSLEEVYPPEDIFSFDAEELAGPGTLFLVARDGAGRALGCVALVECGGYGEVKRLFVRREGRGRGVARALMAVLEATAAARGMTDILLETGERLTAAVGLYEAMGYARRGPFGAYPEHPASLFMGKSLA